MIGASYGDLRGDYRFSVYCERAHHGMEYSNQMQLLKRNVKMAHPLCEYAKLCNPTAKVGEIFLGGSRENYSFLLDGVVYHAFTRSLFTFIKKRK